MDDRFALLKPLVVVAFFRFRYFLFRLQRFFGGGVFRFLAQLAVLSFLRFPSFGWQSFP
jgi:hypothetical protein